jgi:hypothetical protein
VHTRAHICPDRPCDRTLGTAVSTASGRRTPYGRQQGRSLRRFEFFLLKTNKQENRYKRKMVRARRQVAGPASDLHKDRNVSSEDGRGLYTFTDCEMSICRSAQLSSYTGVCVCVGCVYVCAGCVYVCERGDALCRVRVPVTLVVWSALPQASDGSAQLRRRTWGLPTGARAAQRQPRRPISPR